jgi:putative ubiquitin-RnfH superfamily antitoxin RatB of RatAB toxin-antitoxin module
MGPADSARTASVSVQVVYCPKPGEADLSRLQLAPGSTVADALRASGVLERHGLSMEALPVGVWFRVCDLGTVLRERDRVEIYRPLTVDPKEARRLRYKGARRKAGAS